MFRENPDRSSDITQVDPAKRAAAAARLCPTSWWKKRNQTTLEAKSGELGELRLAGS
jgi:hypothetical protein